jgi:hypothetical protein
VFGGMCDVEDSSETEASGPILHSDSMPHYVVCAPMSVFGICFITLKLKSAYKNGNSIEIRTEFSLGHLMSCAERIISKKERNLKVK